jgi:hypothetical protein
MDSGVRLESSASPGFQLSFMPLIPLSRSFSLRTGISLGRRYHDYIQKEPWNAEYREKMTLPGIPVHVLYAFGYPDIGFHVLSGFNLNFLARTELEYSVLAVPSLRQEGSVNISFDRIRFLPEFRIGAGLKLKAGSYYIGIDLVWSAGLRTYSRFDPSRTVYLYNDLEPVIEYYSPAYRSSGVLLNLTFQKWKRRT